MLAWAWWRFRDGFSLSVAIGLPSAFWACFISSPQGLWLMPVRPSFLRHSFRRHRIFFLFWWDLFFLLSKQIKMGIHRCNYIFEREYKLVCFIFWSQSEFQQFIIIRCNPCFPLRQVLGLAFWTWVLLRQQNIGARIQYNFNMNYQTNVI